MKNTIITSDGKERLNRFNYSLEDALREIQEAELILDGMGARQGVTLWGRIASIINELELLKQLKKE